MTPTTYGVPGVGGFAASKVNLALHVTGRRADGYHLLDSLVAFADVGDRVDAHPAPALSLELSGPEAEGLSTGPENLVLKAARSFGMTAGARLRLHKYLPRASGIGGGSADAAATLRVLAALWKRPMPHPDTVLELGADVPACLISKSLRMSGIGDVLAPLATDLPPVWAVLANPRVEVPTTAVFSALEVRENPALPAAWPMWPDAHALAGWLAVQRNDLEAPALQRAPVIGDVLAALAAQPAALLVRMSGSGATCFALFARPQAAEAAARSLGQARPDWWVVDCALA